MEVPICLHSIILHTGIMYCMNLCHSKVVWKYYSGLMCFVGILAFGGWCPHGRCPTTVMIFGTWVCSIESVWQEPKCHQFEAVCPIVPPLKIMCCPVLWCSRCVPVHPDVLVSYQHYYMLLTVMLMCRRYAYL